MVKEIIRPGGVSLLILLLLSACAGTPPPATPTEPVDSSLSDSPFLIGRGSGASRLEAETVAYQDLLRKAAESLLGPGASLTQRTELDRFLAEMIEPGRYLLPESREVIASSEQDGVFELEIGMRIRLQEFAEELRTAGLSGGQLSDPEAPVELADEGMDEPDESDSSAVATASVPETPETIESPAEELELTGLKLSREEERRLAQMLSRLTFLVLPRESAELPAEESAALVNRRIREYGYSAKEYLQARLLMRDGSDSYAAEVDDSVSIERWAAGKMNADLLLLIDSTGRGMEIEILEPLSGKRLFRRTIASDQGWRQSLDRSLEEILSRAEALYAEELSAGLPFELYIRNLDEADVIDAFVRELKGKVRSIGRPQLRDQELLIRIGFLGSAEELETAVFEAGAEVPGTDSLRLLYQQGRCLSFEIGR